MQQNMYNSVTENLPSSALVLLQWYIATYLQKITQQLHKLKCGNNQTNVILPRGTHRTTLMASFHIYLG